MSGGVWGGGYEAVAALSLWLSKLCTQGVAGWLAGWLPACLPEKLVGMQGHGWGRRLLLSLLTMFVSSMFVFVYLKASSNDNSVVKLLLIAFLTFEATGGFLENWLETKRAATD